MGGFGSGRVSTRHRGQVEDTRFIRVGWIKEQLSRLEAGITTRVSWTRNNQPYGMAGVSLIDHKLHIEYQQRSAGEDKWRNVHEVIELTYATPHFGGKRLWLHCPHCGRRVGVLYCCEIVACRRYLHLSYRTESEDAIDRLRSKAAKLKQRLGENPYQRPKGMHQKTFTRLRNQYFDTLFKADELQEQRGAALLKHLEKMTGTKLKLRKRPESSTSFGNFD